MTSNQKEFKKFLWELNQKALLDFLENEKIYARKFYAEWKETGWTPVQ